MTKKPEKMSKRPYEKPRLRGIALVAEEVLAVSCKVASGASGKNGGHCGFSPCSVPGAYGS
ncbi:MAG TPA: hypothetical protein DCP92_06505 [Nitrospiraceae bacterium]|nr:hypothetical protein [Nitrospiraceae bacterium]